VFVPKSIGGMVRVNALLPRRLVEAVGRLLKSDQVLAHPDHIARARYEARMVETITQTQRAPTLTPAPAPERETETETV